MKVRQKTYASGVVKWEADFGEVNGRRIQRYFATREAAENFLRETKATIKSHGEEGVMLSPADRVLFASWKEQLASVGATLEQAGTFFLKHHVPLKDSADLAEMGRQYLDLMRAGGDAALNTQKTVDGLKRPNLLSFFKFLQARDIENIRDITREHVELWLSEVGGKSETKKNRIRTVRHFLEWGRRANYIPFNPLMGRDNSIAIGEEKKGDILSYGTREMKLLLHAALFARHRSNIYRDAGEFELVPYHSFLGYLAAALFCGLRPEEIKRTPLSNLDLAGRRLVVTGQVSKTNKARVIELSSVATAWFRLWRRYCPEQVSLIPEAFAFRWKSLRSVAGIPSLHDGLRHTFATMHYAAHQNAAQLQAVMGHDEKQDTLFAHYRAVKTTAGEWITKAMAQQFWALMPTEVRGPKAGAPIAKRRRNLALRTTIPSR